MRVSTTVPEFYKPVKMVELENNGEDLSDIARSTDDVH